MSPIPAGQDAFSWTMVQSGRLNTEATRLRIFFSVWGNLTVAQQAGLKTEGISVLDSVIAELTDIRTAIAAL